MHWQGEKWIFLLNKIIVLGVVILFILMRVGGLAFADTWDGKSVDEDWYDASLSEFHISSAAQLASFAKTVNDKTDNFRGKTVYLDSDIDLNNAQWMSIGTIQSFFAGTFNGGGHTINNMMPGSKGKIFKNY